MSSKITITQIKSKYDVPFFTATQETRNMVREFKDRGDLIHVTDVYDSEILTRVRTLIFKDRASLLTCSAVNSYVPLCLAFGSFQKNVTMRRGSLSCGVFQVI